MTRAMSILLVVLLSLTYLGHAVRVSGNKLIKDDGSVIRLRGVSHSGSEYACVQGWGFFDGQVDDNAIAVMKTWNINAVRVPLNQACWLNINGVNPQYGGDNYKNAISGFVTRLLNHGMVVILELHWSAPGTESADGQRPMPDADHSPTFWKQVAAAYASSTNVIFDVFNEPFPDSNTIDSDEAWRCWRDGGSCAGFSFQAAGMQSLVDAIRSSGASNVIMLGGINYSNSLVRWLDYQPKDSNGQLAASWHSYDFNACNVASCWDLHIRPVAAAVPLIVGEIGERGCTTSYINQLMPYLDQLEGASYLAWTWNTWDCSGGPALISDYNGSPTPFGQGFHDHLTQFASNSTASSL